MPADISMLNGKRVLVCEDNSLNILIITRMLERVGLVVEVADNGSDGVRLFGSSAIGYYNAILMDIRMPVMNGLEATKLIRAMSRSDAVSVPILAMTADAFERDAEGSRAAGMNEHLSKPIEPQRLYDTLMKYML